MLEAILAADIYLTLGGWSYHHERKYYKCSERSVNGAVFCKDSDFNESHNSIILDYNGYTIGAFRNSFNKRTKLFGYTYRMKNNFSVGAYYGTGYRDFKYDNTKCSIHLLDECLLITASYSFEPFKISLMGDTLAASFEFKLR